MTSRNGNLAALALLAGALLAPAPAEAVVHFQCPASLETAGGYFNMQSPSLSSDPACQDPTAPAFAGCQVSRDEFGYPTGVTDDPDVVCRHLAAGDGFATMADGNVLYTFGFVDVTGVPDDRVMTTGMLAAQFSAPTLVFPEGKKVYLTLSNVGMVMRPDLFDPHTVHFHGFPNASAIFDGEPMSSISINMGSSLTYYYEPLGPGTYMYHCHVEATEHMQMGMLGNLYVTPAQDGNTAFYPSGTYAYNDTDGSTGYDVDVPIQIVAFDKNFHELHIGVQPLPFAGLRDTYPMLNGRGYPDTVYEPPAPTDPVYGLALPAPAENGGKIAQPLPALIEASPGQRILLRISSLSTVDFYTLGLSGGLTMQVVGRDAKHLTGPSGHLYYETNSVMLGGGEAIDAIVDTTGLAINDVYTLYVTNLNHLSNHGEDFGGMLTEIRIVAP